jgi:CUB domain
VLVLDVWHRPCEQKWLTDSSGWIASTIRTGCTSANCHNCESVICIAGTGPIQLRFQTLLPNDLEYASYIDIYDGKTAEGKRIKRLRGESLLTPIESTEKCIFIHLYAEPTYRVSLAFNATYQEKGKMIEKNFCFSK